MQAGRPLSPSEEKRLEKLFSEKIQTKLDAGVGRCFLAKPEIADLVAEVLHHFDGSRYSMYAWCLMPNHVHLLFVFFTSTHSPSCYTRGSPIPRRKQTGS